MLSPLARCSPPFSQPEVLVGIMPTRRPSTGLPVGSRSPTYPRPWWEVHKSIFPRNEAQLGFRSSVLCRAWLVSGYIMISLGQKKGVRKNVGAAENRVKKVRTEYPWSLMWVPSSIFGKWWFFDAHHSNIESKPRRPPRSVGSVHSHVHKVGSLHHICSLFLFHCLADLLT